MVAFDKARTSTNIPGSDQALLCNHLSCVNPRFASSNQILVCPSASRAHGTFMYPRCLHPLRQARCFPLCSSPPLLEQTIPPLVQDIRLPLFHACQPVAETTTSGREKRVRPERLFVEQRTQFDSQLDQADSDAYRRVGVSVYSVMRVWGRYRSPSRILCC